MDRFLKLGGLLLAFCLSAAAAETAPAKALANESELGIVVAGGNSDTQTFTAKHETVYTFDSNITKLFGHYLLGKSGGIKTSENWDIGARYERDFPPSLAAFAQYKLDSNVLAGLDLRHTIDAGGKYYFWKEPGQQLFNETGYRFTSENRLGPAVTVNSHFIRLYFEYNRNLSELITAKLGVELLPNLSDSKGYQANLEAAILASLSPVFSIKTGYSLQYRNQPAGVGKKRTDSLFTTSVVAKF